MKRLLFTLILPAFFLASCSTGGKVTKLTDDGMMAFNSGDYQTALTYFESVIADYESKDQKPQCPVYGKAGQAALNLGKYEKGASYIELAAYYKTADAGDLAKLGEEYERIDNLSKELDALETLYERFPEEARSLKTTQRLFELYIESENWDQAIEMWKDLEQAEKDELANMRGYFQANITLGNNEACDEYADRILTIQPKYIPALEYKAKKFYNLAENRYQAEMEAYENNKTNKQYNQLIKAFETVTKDFQTSLSFFNQLYEIDPSPKYAKYLANIYARLDNKEKAEYYKKKSQ